MNNNKDIMTIKALAVTATIIQLTAGFTLIHSSKKNVVLDAANIVAHIVQSDVSKELSSMGADKDIDAVKATMKLPTSVHISDPVGPWNDPLKKAIQQRTADLMNGDDLSDSNSLGEDFSSQSDAAYSDETNPMMFSANGSAGLNVSGPFGPLDKNNPVRQAIQQRTLDYAKSKYESDATLYNQVKKDAPYATEMYESIISSTQNKPPYIPNDNGSSKYESDATLYNQIKRDAPYATGMYESIISSTQNKPPYIPNDNGSSKYESDATLYNQVKKDAPYATGMYEDIMYAKDPSIKPVPTPDRPPYIPSDSEEHTKSI